MLPRNQQPSNRDQKDEKVKAKKYRNKEIMDPSESSQNRITNALEYYVHSYL